MHILKFSLMSMGTEYFYMWAYSHNQTRDEDLVLKLNKNKTSWLNSQKRYGETANYWSLLGRLLSYINPFSHLFFEKSDFCWYHNFSHCLIKLEAFITCYNQVQISEKRNKNWWTWDSLPIVKLVKLVATNKSKTNLKPGHKIHRLFSF